MLARGVSEEETLNLLVRHMGKHVATERGADGSIVVLLNLLHTDDEAKIAGCEEHPANCLLLSPPTWRRPHAMTASTFLRVAPT